MADNIVLIGFMAVGKGSTARALALVTGRFAIDSDDLIESLTKQKIAKIFAEFGEPFFRELEHRAARWFEHNVTGTIISTGGGFVTVPNLKRIGTVVYLASEFDAIIDRVRRHPNAEKKFRKRPLLRDLDRARALYQRREELYRRAADLEIHVGPGDVAQVAAEIKDALALGDP